MNNNPSKSPTSRWVREVTGADGGPNEAERQVLTAVLAAMRRIRHGTVALAVQDGKVVQLDVTEKQRF